MNCTEYRFDPSVIAALVSERAAALRANRGLSNPMAFWVSVVATRLEQDRRRYRDYGPWWPALKDVMRRNGYDFGGQSDPLIAQAYRFEEDAQTLIAADEFRSAYLQTFMIYTNKFMLDVDSPQMWVLFDADMENT